MYVPSQQQSGTMYSDYSIHGDVGGKSDLIMKTKGLDECHDSFQSLQEYKDQSVSKPSKSKRPIQVSLRTTSIKIIVSMLLFKF